ncbi:MAG: GGDEF domain-containing protein, partial [Treponema sp.]|nr:GGDEF domain-containing protein [Treponema sp.]
VIKSLVNVKYTYQSSTDYGKKMHVLVNIQGGKAQPKDPSKQVIPTRNLFPETMNDEKPSTYLFIPIFNLRYLQGYYVSKDSFLMLRDKVGYNWSRDFGASIEKFRQTLGYKLMSEQLTVLSTQDALSGLLNRTGLDIFAQDLFFKNNVTNKNTLIMFVDINDMKVINDRYGHLHGDLAVKTVAEAIKDIFPKSFLAIRYGGDEFVVIGTKTGNAKIDYQDKLKKDLAQRTKTMSLPYSLSVSMGIKEFLPDKNAKLMQAIEEVDEIMYKSKEEYHRKKLK